MSEPRLIGDIIVAILADLRAHDIGQAFQQEWSDVTDILRLPSLRSIDMQIKIGDGLIQATKVEGRTYCKNTDIEKIYGTPDYFIKIRRRNPRRLSTKAVEGQNSLQHWIVGGS